MSYAAEPYAQFVDDLLTGLTGGVVRERFVFLTDNQPFQLSPPGTVLRETVRVHGQAAAAYRRFIVGRDYDVGNDDSILWRTDGSGSRAADAVWPDEGTPFFVAYEHRAFTGAPPRLTDRNVGSITRLLAESFAREYAVLSRQLQTVYEAGFLDTATGRDLEQLVRLVGLERRGSRFAVGTAVFSRSTPAPADIFVPAGTRVSAGEPPGTTFETTESGVARRGSLSVEVPIQSLVPGGDGVIPANVITVVHKPILGIQRVSNPVATAFARGDEPDDALRARARRALEGAGRSTRSALISALTAIPGIREKDIRVSEDHLQHPGVVRVDVVAPDLTPSDAERAVAALEETRAAGIRVVHNLPVSGETALEEAAPPLLTEDPPEEVVVMSVVPTAAPGQFPVAVEAIVVPSALDLTSGQRAELKSAAEVVIEAFIDEAGVGETLVYNRLVSQLMAIEGVLDVDVALYAPDATPASTRRRNLIPGDAARRAVLRSPADLLVTVGGAPLALDLDVKVTMQGAGLVGDLANNKGAAYDELLLAIEGILRAWPVDRVLTLAALRASVVALEADTWRAELNTYKADYVEAGVRILRTNPELELTGMERLFVDELVVTYFPGGGA